MAYQQVSLELIRDGQCTPWGFRMTGGADIGAPLVVQKITFGSPSEGELSKGDIILKIRESNATQLSHQAATDLISKAGSTLKLVVARSISPSSMISSPTSPVPQQNMRQPMTHADGNAFLFKPLPTTNFGTQQQRYRRSSTESYTSTTSSDTEKDAITNQPYRSTPLILPGAKTSKDIPTGSYLRFDALSRRTNTPPNVGYRLGDPFMLTKVQESIIEAAHSSSNISSPRRTPTPDLGMYNGNQIYVKQYNSPIHMYSNQAIVEALAEQTKCMKGAAINNAELLEKKKFTNIEQSPTYQLIQEEELKKGKIQECGPPTEHVYNVLPGGVNYKSDIHQSDSFKTIMHDLKGVSDF
ncbi:PDZ and LIM domain protein Zasp [Caerostris darwini]|uniref:PDZ and LIM domain protein Zasp n=1 Tax=Caerostris darwini TaxID=1538125 RepID=A0AAV4MYD9_9ARAC|nr:PDZ and LIM domain protein Zasp [Caerostris darwini]